MPHISSAALGTRAVPMKRNRNSVRVDIISGFGPIANALVLGVILAMLGVLYITQVTKTNSFGYQINNLTTQKNNLVDQKQQLEIDIARLQSQERLAQGNASSAAQEPSKTIYIDN